MRSRTIDLDGPVHYADFGGTGPTLVLVHGLGGSHVNWLAVAPVLARRARVLAVDLAGFGRTPLGERSADVHANRVLLDRFLDAVAAGPAVLVGNSMGGLVAMMEAALAAVTVPTLVIHGRDDPLVPVEAGLDTAEAVPGAELLVIDGMGHDLPRALWPRIIDRISALTARA